MTAEARYDLADQTPLTEGVTVAAAPEMAGAPVDGMGCHAGAADETVPHARVDVLHRWQGCQPVVGLLLK